MEQPTAISPAEHATTPQRMAPEAAEVIRRCRRAGWRWCSNCNSWQPLYHFGVAVAR